MCKIQTIKQEWKGHTHYILIFDGGKGSCQINVYADKQDFGGNVCVYALYVESEYRNQGIAKALLNEAEVISMANGYNFLFLNYDANESEDHLINFYENLGYKPQFILYKKEL